MAELYVKKLSKSFGDKKIFENVSFELQKGEIVGLIGRNGIGKSTLFKVIKKLEHHDSGSIIVGSGLKIGYLVPNLLT